MKFKNRIQDFAKTPWGLIAVAIIICAFLYTMNSIIAPYSDRISTYASVFFLLICLVATIVVFQNRFGKLYRISIVIFTFICTLIPFHGVIFKEYYVKKLDELIIEKDYNIHSDLKVRGILEKEIRTHKK